MTSGLGPIATAGHLAPASTAGPRVVVEDPAARVTGAGPQSLGPTGRDLADDRLGQVGQGVVDRVADVPMIEAEAVGARDELDHLAGAQGSVDLVH